MPDTLLKLCPSRRESPLQQPHHPRRFRQRMREKTVLRVVEQCRQVAVLRAAHPRRPPVPLLAKSFDLLLSEIDHLEHDTRGDNDRWTIVARNGSRYEVTEQYRLPVKRVMRILQATEPPLRIVELTQWESPWSKRKKARRRKDGAQL